MLGMEKVKDQVKGDEDKPPVFMLRGIFWLDFATGFCIFIHSRLELSGFADVGTGQALSRDDWLSPFLFKPCLFQKYIIRDIN